MWIAGRSVVFQSICIERHTISGCIRVFDDAQMAVVGRGTRSERFPGTRTTLLFTLADAHVETRTRLIWPGQVVDEVSDEECKEEEEQARSHVTLATARTPIHNMHAHARTCTCDQTNRQTDRQTDRQTGMPTNTCVRPHSSLEVGLSQIRGGDGARGCGAKAGTRLVAGGIYAGSV